MGKLRNVEVETVVFNLATSRGSVNKNIICCFVGIYLPLFVVYFKNRKVEIYILLLLLVFYKIKIMKEINIFN